MEKAESSQTSGRPKKEPYVPFAVRYNLKERKERFEKQRQEKPNFIPLIVERHPKSTLPDIDKCKFTCEKSQKFIMVLKIIKDKIEKLQKAETGKPLKNDGKSSFFLYVGSSIPHGDQQIQEIYTKNHAEDGFLYVKYGQMEKF